MYITRTLPFKVEHPRESTTEYTYINKSRDGNVRPGSKIQHNNKRHVVQLNVRPKVCTRLCFSFENYYLIMYMKEYRKRSLLISKYVFQKLGRAQQELHIYLASLLTFSL